MGVGPGTDFQQFGTADTEWLKSESKSDLFLMLSSYLFKIKTKVTDDRLSL